MVPVALRAPSTMPAPQPCSVLIPCFEVTNSETAGFRSQLSTLCNFNVEIQPVFDVRNIITYKSIETSEHE